MDLVSAVVADEQSFELVQPGEGAFDDPAVAAEPGAMLDPSASDLGDDAAAAQLAAVLVVVITTVGADPFGSPTRTAGFASDGRDTVEQRQQLGDVVAVAARDRPGERDPGRVYEQVMLGAVSGSVNRARARFGAPLAECGSGCQPGGERSRVLRAAVAARGSSLSLVRGSGAGDMIVDGDSRGRLSPAAQSFAANEARVTRLRHGAFGSRPEAFG